jgi:hypothetical protein
MVAAISTPLRESYPPWVWHNAKELAPRSSGNLLRRALWTIETFEEYLSIQVTASSRLGLAKALLEEIQEGGPIPASSDPNRLRQIQEAHRTIDEFFMIAKGVVFRPYYRIAPERAELVKRALGGAPDEKTDADRDARNIQFQLLVGAQLALAYCTLEDEEPDLVLHFFHSTFGIAAKRLNSPSDGAMEDRLKHGGKQLRNHHLQGFVAINIDTVLDGVQPGKSVDVLGEEFNKRVPSPTRVTHWLRNYPEVLGVLVFGYTAEWMSEGLDGVAHLNLNRAVRVAKHGSSQTLTPDAIEFFAFVSKQMPEVW